MLGDLIVHRWGAAKQLLLFFQELMVLDAFFLVFSRHHGRTPKKLNQEEDTKAKIKLEITIDAALPLTKSTAAFSTAAESPWLATPAINPPIVQMAKKEIKAKRIKQTQAVTILFSNSMPIVLEDEGFL